MLAWIIIGFLASSFLIIFSGSKLSYYGDQIAEITGMGKAWFGLIMMAAVTSLPELITGISAVTFINSPDIAVGDIMGSCAFNLLILAFLDFFIPGKSLTSSITQGHALAGFISILLLTIVVISFHYHSWIPQLEWFSVSSLIIAVIYIAAIRLIYKKDAVNVNNPASDDPLISQSHKIELQIAIRKYAAFAGLVIAGAIALPYFSDQLAELSGLSKSLVGTLLVAASTSLPELVVSITAVRMGSTDIAAGNLLGSNLFNMMIISIDDLFYSGGSLFSAASPLHALSGLFALLMTAIAGIGIIYHAGSKRYWLGMDALAIILLYILLISLLFYLQ